MAIPTHGLTHLSLSVRDPERSKAFYERLFGVREVHREAGQIQVQGPGEHDLLAFQQREGAGEKGGIDHFGFRLRTPDDIEIALREAREAGAKILRHGEFAPGMPYVYIEDPDGYTIEIWYE